MSQTLYFSVYYPTLKSKRKGKKKENLHKFPLFIKANSASALCKYIKMGSE